MSDIITSADTRLITRLQSMLYSGPALIGVAYQDAHAILTRDAEDGELAWQINNHDNLAYGPHDAVFSLHVGRLDDDTSFDAKIIDYCEQNDHQTDELSDAVIDKIRYQTWFEIVEQITSADSGLDYDLVEALLEYEIAE